MIKVFQKKKKSKQKFCTLLSFLVLQSQFWRLEREGNKFWRALWWALPLRVHHREGMPKIITSTVTLVCVWEKCHDFSFTFHSHHNADKSAAWKRLNGLLTGLLTSRRWRISRVALKSIWEIDLESASALILVFPFSFVFFQLPFPFSNFKQEKERMVIVYSKQTILQLGSR